MFRTEISLTPLPHQLPPSARVLTLGSCFSDTIGARLAEFKVATLVNPFGTVFNPLSACKLLRAAAGEDVDWQQHLVEARGRWQSYDLHADIGADSPVELLQRIQQLTREVGVFLATADAVVLTLGSAYAYRLRETGELVSNCHKIEADQFDKELLTADEIIAAVAETHAYLRRINPKLRFILTVSPVRHLKDTLVLNSASKAMLRIACHYLSELLPEVTYFPAYELLVDDLRDYRFYATDMLHLSEAAENYMWEKFTRTYFDTSFGRFKKEWEGIRQNLGHRPLHAAAPEHRAFLEGTLERLRKLSGSVDVRMELLHVERELANLPEPKVLAPAAEETPDDGEERIDIGSFDDQAALDEAQPVAAAALAAAIPRAASRQEGKKKPINKAVFAKSRLTSEASLLRPGAGLLVEDAAEAEMEPEDADENNVSADSAYDHAYSPAITGLTDEAEANGNEAADDDHDEPNGPETAEEAARRKKRRSRGGAKRTKRKHARLAAEQTSSTDQPETSTAVTATAPLPSEPLPGGIAEASGAEVSGVEMADTESALNVVYVTEAELRQPRSRPETAEPTPIALPELASGNEPAPTGLQTDEPTQEARRSRNNRRGSKREQAPRYGGRPNRQPLYAIDGEASVPVETPPVPPLAPEVSASDAAIPVTSVEVAASTAADSTTPNPIETQKKPAARKRPSKAKAASADEQTSVTASPTLATAAIAPAPTTAQATEAPTDLQPAATSRPARRKPAAKPKTPATTTVAVTEVSASPIATLPVAAQAEPVAEPAKAPPRKRAATKPKSATKVPATLTGAVAPEEVAAVAVTAEPPVPAVTPKAPIKSKPKAATKPKAAAKKAVVKAKPAAEASGAAAASAKAPPKARAKTVAKPKASKKATPETPETE